MKSRIYEKKVMFFEDIRSKKLEVFLKFFPRKKKKKKGKKKGKKKWLLKFKDKFIYIQYLYIISNFYFIFL